jgi:hypothetical protein
LKTAGDGFELYQVLNKVFIKNEGDFTLLYSLEKDQAKRSVYKIINTGDKFNLADVKNNKRARYIFDQLKKKYE